jgi:hypothetical protein
MGAYSSRPVLRNSCRDGPTWGRPEKNPARLPAPDRALHQKVNCERTAMTFGSSG